MTDKELIELAAKAAGIEIGWDSQGAFLYEPEICALSDAWNPLTDDGDALRLAIALDMNIYIGFKKIYAEIISDGDEPPITVAFDKSDDPYAATRRAIVRAAAEIESAYDRQSA